MQFHQLQRAHKNAKRMTVARGGKRGKTSGRGGKGQSARAGNKRRPEWRDIIKRLPKLRGRGVNMNKPVSDPFKAVNVSLIEAVFSAGEAVTPRALLEKGVVETFSGNMPQIKILGDGEITKAVKVSGCAVSQSAKEKIEKVGGTVALIAPKAPQKGEAIEAKKEKKEEPKNETKAPANKEAKEKTEKKAPAKKAKAE